MFCGAVEYWGVSMSNIMYVVGDGFVNFSKTVGVVRISDFEEMISLPRIGKATNGFYIIGQGISEERIKKIKQRLQDSKINDIFIKDNFCEKEQNQFVHKTLRENVMISQPKVIRDGLFVSRLMIDDRCAEMSDHLTGQHVQGVVLIEAARQMGLSVSEHFFLSNEERFKRYFVLNNLDVQFQQFVFPLEVEMRCIVLEHKNLGEENFTIKYAIEFVQNNISCTRIIIGLMADAKAKLEAKEARLADFNLKCACLTEEANLAHFLHGDQRVQEIC